MSNGVVVGALLFVAAHMEVVVARAPVGQSVNQRWIAMEGKDDWLVGREQRIEIVIRHTVRVFTRGLQLHQIDDIDDANLEIGRVSSKQVDSGERLQRWHVTAASHHDIGLAAVVVAGPLPNTQSGFAVLDRLVHRQPLRSRLLARHDDVDVVSATQTMVGDREQAVGVGRQIDADDLGFLVDDVVDEPRVLVAEAVVILAPDMARQEVIQRANRPSPGDVIAHLQPLGVLIKHRIDDVDERFIAREKTVPAGQEIALEPALALVLAEHLHDPPVGRQMIIPRIGVCDPGTIGDLERILPAVRVVLVRTEEPEISRLHVELHHIA